MYITYWTAHLKIAHMGNLTGILPDLLILKKLVKKKKIQFLSRKSHSSSAETATWLAVVLDSTERIFLSA